MANDRLVASVRALGLAALVAGAASAPAGALPIQTADGGKAASTREVARSVQDVQSNSGAPAPAAGIVFETATPDSIITIRTAQGIITRIALPKPAKEAICGDLFDPPSGTGSFVISNSGNDVFVKPVNSKAQTNLFVKADDGSVYNFDLVVVPAKEAHRVVNVNVPTFEQQVEQLREKARREIAAERAQMEGEVQQQLDARLRELEKQNAAALAAEQKKLRGDADRRATDLAARRFVDGVMQGVETVSMRERRVELVGVEVALDDAAYVFDGRLYVRYRVVNKGTEDLTYIEPRAVVRGESDRLVESTVVSSRGDFVVPAGETVYGVVVLERPTLDKGQRLYFYLKFEGSDRSALIRMLDQA